MPEIIEVEITKQKLKSAIQGKRILDFWTDWPRGLISQEGGMKKTTKKLKGKKINGLSRKGKAVILNLEGHKILAIHQRMSGHMPVNLPENKHTRFRIFLSDNTDVSLVDPRKFGVVWYGSEKWFNEQPYIKNLGYDAMSIKRSQLFRILSNSRSSLKSLLLNQSKIAGLGNIACDEILWRARLNPLCRADTLNVREAELLYKSIYTILADVLRYGGTSMSNWRHPDGEQGNYQKKFKIYKQKKCVRCKKSIKSEKIAGRSTYFCKICQPSKI